MDWKRFRALSKRSARVKLFLGILVFCVLIFAVRLVNWGALATWLLSAMENLGFRGIVLFILIKAIVIVFSLPGSLLAMAAGASLGFWRAVWMVFLGDMLGATCCFLISRYVARQWVSDHLVNHKYLRVLDREISRHGIRILILLRFAKIIPFVVLNYGLGMTSARFRDFVISTIAILPATAFLVLGGTMVGDMARILQDETTETLHWLQYAGFGIAGATTIIAVLVLSQIARRTIQDSAVEGDLPPQQP
ncbi:TVP38/TMEM64 family protein [bacterium]|nr:TVP38/TMEM64 family protein [bacterium]